MILNGDVLKIYPFYFTTLLIFLFKHVEASYWQENETPTLSYLKPIELTATSSGIDLIDAIYVINLDRRTDRMERMNQILNNWDLFANRLSACDGNLDLSDWQAQELTGPYHDCMLYKGNYGSYSGAIGCLLSHLSVIQDAHTRGFDIIWVLEDDIEIIDNPRHIPALLKELSSIDSQWDLFYTDPDPHIHHSKTYYKALDMPSRPRRPGQPFPSVSADNRKRRAAKHIDRVYWRTGGHSLIISKRGIEKILNYFSHVYLYDHIDREFHLIPDIRLYCSRSDIVTNSSSPEALKSDIENKRKK